MLRRIELEIIFPLKMCKIGKKNIEKQKERALKGHRLMLLRFIIGESMKNSEEQIYKKKI